MHTVVWTDPARQDLRLCYSFIAADSPAAAERFIAQIQRRVSSISAFPQQYPECEHPSLQGMRRAVVGSYSLYYHVEANTILLLGLIHGARNFPPPEEEDDAESEDDQ
jgi:toxin ParE1/3/4